MLKIQIRNGLLSIHEVFTVTGMKHQNSIILLKVNIPLIPNGSLQTSDRKIAMLDGMQVIASWSSSSGEVREKRE